ncbi:MAG: alpha-1,2-fucosyltransferase, partial [Lachnospiraceae bacterium]|nr:alpha-1,2-fucosyltransferase [Lachnospiraceae bacterium]
NALQYILKRNPHSSFYVFSDDKEWAASHYTGERFRVVGVEDALSDTEEFLLMSACRHHILANSSFSWWSAWIRDTPEKITIAPSRWINGQRMRSIYTPRMTRI